MTDNFYANNDVRLNEANALLNQLSVEELNKLLNNEQEMNKFIQKVQEVSLSKVQRSFRIHRFFFIQIQQLEAVKESIRENNRQIALQNLQKEPQLKQEKQKLADLHAELARLREEYRSKHGQYGE